MISDLDIVTGSDGLINYSEFLAATLDIKKIVTDEKLMSIFKMFDIDNTGTITVKNMKTAFEKQGYNVSVSEIRKYINRYDADENASIEFNEFKKIFLDNEEIQPSGRLESSKQVIPVRPVAAEGSSKKLSIVQTAAEGGSMLSPTDGNGGMRAAAEIPKTSSRVDKKQSSSHTLQLNKIESNDNL